MSGSAMNLDINVEEHDWKTLPIPNNVSIHPLFSTFAPTTTHPLLPPQPKTVQTATKTTAKKDVPPINPEDDPLRAMLANPLAAPSAEDDKQSVSADLPSDPTLPAEITPPNLTKAQQEDPRALLLSKLSRRFEFWREKEPMILDKYTTSASIAVDNSFLNEGKADPFGELEEAKQQAQKGKKTDQAQSRLEEIEHESSASTKEAKSYLSQKDFIKHIEEQHEKLLAAWENGERVVALRVVIQCAKLLGDMTIPQFYPSMFVILTRILDTFGDLVFTRIRERGIESIDPYTKQIIYQPLSASFKASDVCSSAKETCKNWFFKTTCIRELLPRLYIDMSLIKCYRFLEDESFSENLHRVTQQIRGVGDPLTASYLRSYIATKALDISYSFHDVLPTPSQRYHVAPIYRQSVKLACEDWLTQHRYLKTTQCANIPIVAQGIITAQQYFDLMSPSLEWIIQVLYYTEDSDKDFIHYLKNIVKGHDDLPILKAVVNAFHPNFIKTHLDTILTSIHAMLDELREKYASYEQIIQEELYENEDSDVDSDEDDKSSKASQKPKKDGKQSHTQSSTEYQSFVVLHKYVEEYSTAVFALICKKLIMYTQQPNTTLTMTSTLLNALWSGICDCPYKEYYNLNSPALALLICIHGRWSDQQVLLKSALKTLQSKTRTSMVASSDNEEDQIEYNNTMNSVENIFSLSPHINSLLTCDYILAILDQLQRLQRVYMSTILLKRYKQWILDQQEKRLPWHTNDTILIHTLHELCTHMHFSINALSESYLLESASDLCMYVILSINYGNDVETQLSTYVSFRSSLSELPSVLTLLVHQANKLSLYALKMVSHKATNNGAGNKGALSAANHTRKTTSFVKAAIAFCHITIPSLPHSNNSNIYERISLFLATAQTSIVNNLLPQAEALITAAIQQLSLLSADLNSSSDNKDSSVNGHLYKFMSVHDLSQQVTTTVQYILATLCQLPPVGGQWLRLLGVILNIIEKQTCPCIDIIATPQIYVNSLYVIAVMTQKQSVGGAVTISDEESQAITAAKCMIIHKLLFSVKVVYSVGGGIVTGMTKDENTQITTIISNLQHKYPPQLVCDTLTTIAQSFFNCMRIDAYTATIIFAIITGVREVLKSHPYSVATMDYFIQYATDVSNAVTNGEISTFSAKEVKLYAGLAKKLNQFLGK